MTSLEPLPEPRRVYVIGDIHGCADLLDRMIEEINKDLATHPEPDSLVVTVGDYVDRGPASRSVIEHLRQNPFPTPFIPLKGNHEVLLEGFLRDPQTATFWQRLGGTETIHSYGVAASNVMGEQEAITVARALAQAIPPSHFDFLAWLRTSLAVGRYFICHAGVRPGVVLEEQAEQDLLWIREPFLTSLVDFGKIVVHGHTPTEQPELLQNRINVDTGAFITGRLTCAVLQTDRARFLTATCSDRSFTRNPSWRPS
jgi:diadenosine tetraphosphatase ApaH/serine/threonine PP2A family protein phosphatase